MFESDDLRLRVEAARHLEGLLKPLEHSEAEEWIERIVEGEAKRNLDSAVVDKDTLVSVVQVGDSTFTFTMVFSSACLNFSLSQA